MFLFTTPDPKSAILDIFKQANPLLADADVNKLTITKIVNGTVKIRV